MSGTSTTPLNTNIACIRIFNDIILTEIVSDISIFSIRVVCPKRVRCVYTKVWALLCLFAINNGTIVQTKEQFLEYFSYVILKSLLNKKTESQNN